ncbi:PEPxxWA-CTERM sorting domain-containing protein [Sphingomonas piscis]|uniref:Npun_F0296 family exosortase-dependent surface protein n=1 Tax=Sphingomonas piscis TaxID=2714943 RepID=UPI001FEB4599|nr:PEPxxWA-CTERM sorting domain-containing protein [Sphingomonas piscis]
MSDAGLNGGTIATLSGGTVYSEDKPIADIPAGTAPGTNFLAAGPSSGQVATLTFTAPLRSFGFLWGSPDWYNRLSVKSDFGVYNFTASSLGFPVSNGDQSFGQYVRFVAGAADQIRSVTFANSSQIDAFEVSNFQVSAVPDPATWATMIIGFGAIGFAMRASRRKGTRLARA